MKAVVAGAGIGGLAASLALARAGHQVEVIEAAGELKEVGAGLQMSPNGFRAMAALGIADRVDAICYRPRANAMFDTLTGARLAEQPFGKGFEERFGFPYRVAHRADLQSVLLEAVRARADAVAIRLGERLTDFSQDGDCVTVALAGGGIVRGDILIGADGLWSRVREILHGRHAPSHVAGYLAYRAVVPLADVPEEVRSDAVQVWVGPDHHVVSYPLRRDGSIVNIGASLRSNRIVEGWGTPGNVGELLAGFDGVCPLLRSLLSTPADWRVWTLADRDPIPQWGRGRVTLLGDAAHPMLPHMAQGAGMALEDAVQLGDEIARRGEDVASAIHAYEGARVPRTASVQLTSRATGKAFHASGAHREQRNAALTDRNDRGYEDIAWLFDGEGPRPDLAGQFQFGLFRVNDPQADMA